uniref:Sperm microtubule inner protein 5 n=1 Tax=Salvator merianae TaxID=96440 RepID=A0A8D0BHE3_SALMN
MEAFRREVDEGHPLIPGYTGYIPLRFYRIGTSFGNDSVWCVNAFRDATQKKTNQMDELRYTAATAPQLPPICSNEDVINVLDDYNYKHHPNVLVETKRSLLEPPIPGWTGFVPRSKVTEFGHGVRYHVMAENCYQDFKNSLDRDKRSPDTQETKYVGIKLLGLKYGASEYSFQPITSECCFAFVCIYNSSDYISVCKSVLPPSVNAP